MREGLAALHAVKIKKLKVHPFTKKGQRFRQSAGKYKEIIQAKLRRLFM